MNNIKLKELIYDLYKTKTFPDAKQLILSFLSIPTHVYILQVPYTDRKPTKFFIVKEKNAEQHADNLYLNMSDSSIRSVEYGVTVEKTYFLNDKWIAKFERKKLDVE